MTKSQKKRLQRVSVLHKQGLWKTFRRTENPILAIYLHGCYWRVLQAPKK